MTAGHVLGGVNVQISLLTVGMAAACWFAVRRRSAKSRRLLLSNFRVEEVLKDEVWYGSGKKHWPPVQWTSLMFSYVN